MCKRGKNSDRKKRRKQRKKSDKRIYYVVTVGRRIGIYRDGKKAMNQISGYPNSKIKKVRGLEESRKYFSKHKDTTIDVYYVVRIGRSPGLYKDRKEAFEQVKNYPNGLMKKVKGHSKAVEYLNADMNGAGVVPFHAMPTIYIDGSYMQSKGLSGYGYLVEIAGKVLYRNSGVILDSDFINMQSLGAELYTFLRALEWGMANNYNEIRIVYDSTGIVDLIKNSDTFRVKRSKGRSKFIEIYKQYSKHLLIHTVHKNENEVWKQLHKQAHNLSRLSIGILSATISQAVGEELEEIEGWFQM